MEDEEEVAGAAPPDEEPDLEPRTPMKRLGSTRKLAAFNSIRLQLGEQTRVLEARAEAAAATVGELHDYCRRRGELEHEYSRALDKLARTAAQRREHNERARRERPPHAAHACWRAALHAARALAADHAALAALYAGPLAARLQRAADDALRLHRKCRDVLLERHEEVFAALAAAAAAGKAHAAAAAERRAHALKLRAALDARHDPPRHKKRKALDKELDKRRARHGAARAAALRARAEHALALEAANATLQRYYLDDVGELVLCAEVGLEAVVGRAVRCAGAAEAARGAAAGGAAGALRAAADALDAAADRRRLLEAHASAFALPRALTAPPEEEPAPDALLGEEEAAAPEGAAEAAARAELEARLRRLEAGARSLRAECQENAKTLDAAEAELVRQMEGDDSQWDVEGLFGRGGGEARVPPVPPVPPAPPEDQEDYYLAKFRAYVACAARLARAEGKAGALRTLLGAPTPPCPGAGGVPARAARRGGCFLAAPEPGALPAVLTECVRVIAAHGLRAPGVFRVSGSAAEVAALRAALERGERALAARGAPDVHAVCALLKLWLRELRPALLPPPLQARLARLAAAPADDAWAPRLRSVLRALAPGALLVLRYLFAFLAHVASHARHNLMDAWNLAVCVGPALLAAAGGARQQLQHQHLLNELVKRTIELHAEVFPQDVAPHALYDPAAFEPVEEEGAETAAEEAEEAACAALSPEPPDTPPSDTDEESSEEAPPSPAEPAATPELAAPPEPAPPEPAPPEPTPPAPTPPAPSPPGAAALLEDATPDLVRHLPPDTADTADTPDAPDTPDAADTFAHNQHTLRKRNRSRSGSPDDAGAGAGAGAPPEPEGAGGGGGGQAARVAASFAALTLTGGARPALPHKPALLRRPTPHPRH